MARPCKTGLDWFTLDVGISRDRKLKVLARRLGITLTTCLGLYVRFVEWVAEQEPTGILTGLTKDDIDAICGWFEEKKNRASGALCDSFAQGMKHGSVRLLKREGREKRVVSGWESRNGKQWRELVRRRKAGLRGSNAPQNGDKTSPEPPQNPPQQYSTLLGTEEHTHGGTGTEEERAQAVCVLKGYFGEETAEELAARYDLPYIRAKVGLIDQVKPKNPAGFLLKALADDYQPKASPNGQVEIQKLAERLKAGEELEAKWNGKVFSITVHGKTPYHTLALSAPADEVRRRRVTMDTDLKPYEIVAKAGAQ